MVYILRRILPRTAPHHVLSSPRATVSSLRSCPPVRQRKVKEANSVQADQSKNGIGTHRHSAAGTRQRGFRRFCVVVSGTLLEHSQETRASHGEVQPEGASEAAGRGEVDRRRPGPAVRGSGGCTCEEQTVAARTAFAIVKQVFILEKPNKLLLLSL